MFELPEIVTLAREVNEVLPGKAIAEGRLGSRPHKFVWYNREPDEFASLTAGKSIGTAEARGRWLLVPLEPDYLLVLGEIGGRLLYQPPGAGDPDAYHLLLRFTDGSALSAMTQQWGAMELHRRGEEAEHPYLGGMRATPIDPAFTFGHFDRLVDEVAADTKRHSVKDLLVLGQRIPGLGNAIAQDILFAAHLDPRHSTRELGAEQRRALYDSIRETVKRAIAAGGRAEETDLFGNAGGYERLMARDRVGAPCPRCGATVEKIQYLGGACYLCPGCQN